MDPGPQDRIPHRLVRIVVSFLFSGLEAFPGKVFLFRFRLRRTATTANQSAARGRRPPRASSRFTIESL